MTPIVLEAGPEAGHSVRQWQHVQLFSPWEYNVDKAAARLLAPTGWNSPDPAVYPTGAELLERYIEPLATKTASARRDPDEQPGDRRRARRVRQSQDQGPRGGAFRDPLPERQGSGDPACRRRHRRVRNMGSPNPAGAGGLPAIGEREAAAKIAYGMPDVLGRDRERYAGKTVAVLGAGHSAIGTLTDLAALAQQASGTRRDLAAARRQSGESFRWRSQRQACRPRRTRRPFRFASRGRPGAGRSRISSRRGRRGRRPAPDRRPRPDAAAAASSSTN